MSSENAPFIHIDIKDFIDRYWKPNQDDSFIVVEKTSPRHDELVDWFENHKDYTINVGPFVKIKPYGMADDMENPEERTEFLFIYESIDNTKLKKHHLALV